MGEHVTQDDAGCTNPYGYCTFNEWLGTESKDLNAHELHDLPPSNKTECDHEGTETLTNTQRKDKDHS